MSEPTPNPLTETTYSGSYYTFPATGTFTMDQSFSTIMLQPQTDASYVDVTNSIQVKFDVRTFNRKLGLLKDSSNMLVLDSSYDITNDVYPTDSITINATEFVDGMKATQVITTGAYSTLYSSFKSYVQTYFNYAGGFTSLFIGAEDFSYNNDVFDAVAFMNLIDPSAANTAITTITPLSGSITISDINKSLRYAIDSNVFNNRNAINYDLSASDPSDNTNWGMAAGFVAGDLVWVPAGTVINLKLGIHAENFTNALNNVGTVNVSSIADITNGLFTTTSTASTLSINRTLTAPLLIKLANLSTV